MEGFFFFWPIKGIIRGNLPDVQGLPDFLISGAAGAGGHSQFVLFNFFLVSLNQPESSVLRPPHSSSSGGAAGGVAKRKLSCIFVCWFVCFAPIKAQNKSRSRISF